MMSAFASSALPPLASSSSSSSTFSSLSRIPIARFSSKVSHTSRIPFVEAQCLPIDSGFYGPPSAPGAPPKRVIVWLDGALRVEDNAALLLGARAAGGPGGMLVPFALSSDCGAMRETQAKLEQLGSGLVRGEGDVVHALTRVVRRMKIEAVYVNVVGTAENSRMLRHVEEALQEISVQVVRCWGNTLVEGDRLGEMGLPEMRKKMASIKGVAVPDEAPQKLPSLPADARKLDRGGAKACVGEGTAAAMKVLNGMRKEDEMAGCTKLAVKLRPFLNVGAISVKMVAKKVLDVVGELKGATFEEMIWRSFAVVEYARMKSGTTQPALATM